MTPSTTIDLTAAEQLFKVAEDSIRAEASSEGVDADNDRKLADAQAAKAASAADVISKRADAFSALGAIAAFFLDAQSKFAPPPVPPPPAQFPVSGSVSGGTGFTIS